MEDDIDDVVHGNSGNQQHTNSIQPEKHQCENEPADPAIFGEEPACQVQQQDNCRNHDHDDQKAVVQKLHAHKFRTVILDGILAAHQHTQVHKDIRNKGRKQEICIPVCKQQDDVDRGKHHHKQQIGPCAVILRFQALALGQVLLRRGIAKNTHNTLSLFFIGSLFSL